jgi:hypothetical protein
MDPKWKRNDDMRAAIRLATAAFDNGPWRLAIRDVDGAYERLATGSDDAFVYAYRAVEDLAHAVSPTAQKNWAALQTHLGISEQTLKSRTKRLLDARNAVVHGDSGAAALVTARTDPTRLVRESRALVRQALAKSKLPTI